MQKQAKKTALVLFEKHNGILGTAEALQMGIQPRTLYNLRDRGEIIQVERGLFRLRDFPPLTNPDLVIVGSKIPKGVVCLVSALAFHELTTEIPHEVYVALPKGKQKPRIAYPPIRYFWLAMDAYAAGVEQHDIDGITVQIYSRAKTVADCFKFRNKIGLDVAIAALKQYVAENGNLAHLQQFAYINRVTTLMQPYIEALA